MSETLFFVPKPRIKITKWDTLLFETSPVDVFITFQGKSGVFEEAGDSKAPLSALTGSF